MRISEDRYTHELQSIDIALRFIHLQARTHTIRTWTGLSGDRVRSLHQTYVSQSPHYVPRPRGRSPYKISHFMRSPRQIEETTSLARLLSLLGVVPPGPGIEQLQQVLPDPERAQLICFAYEMYAAQVNGPLYTFEHAIFLTRSLITAEQLLLDNCVECGGLAVTEEFMKGVTRCSYCGLRSR